MARKKELDGGEVDKDQHPWVHYSKKVGIAAAIVCVLLVAFFVGKEWIYPNTPTTASGSTSTDIQANLEGVVATGPSCDGQQRTVQLDDTTRPVRVGCTMAWDFDPASTSNTVIVVGANGTEKTTHGDGVSNFAVSGWRALPGETVLIDVAYCKPHEQWNVDHCEHIETASLD